MPPGRERWPGGETRSESSSTGGLAAALRVLPEVLEALRQAGDDTRR
jgi:hypothetical protein